MQKFTPITPIALITSITDRIMASTARTVVGVDGADAASPWDLARQVGETVHSRGRSCAVVSLHDYVRPASLRYEFSREDELSYRTAWFDFDALRREVLDPLSPGGRGTFLPRLWDERTDRSARDKLVDAAADHVVVVAGPMMLGRGLGFGLTVHLHLSDGALARKTVDGWTVAPLIAYYGAQSEKPDMTVRWDHPGRPAVSN